MMGLFGSKPQPPQPPSPDKGLPVLPIDLTKRYDVYLRDGTHERLYENIRFVSLRSFDRITDFSPGTLSCYLEIEALDGTQCLIPTIQITAVCAHGVKMASMLLRRKNS